MIIVAVSLLLVIGLAELALRLADVSYPIFYKYDSLTGGALRPGVEGW
ncbi:MAG: hypothetical protein NNA18_07265 [Nitrospira sp.]|nr:hypothetical protein [Nitrospira sp.]